MLSRIKNKTPTSLSAISLAGLSLEEPLPLMLENQVAAACASTLPEYIKFMGIERANIDDVFQASRTAVEVTRTTMITYAMRFLVSAPGTEPTMVVKKIDLPSDDCPLEISSVAYARRYQLFDDCLSPDNKSMFFGLPRDKFHVSGSPTLVWKNGVLVPTTPLYGKIHRAAKSLNTFLLHYCWAAYSKHGIEQFFRTNYGVDIIVGDDSIIPIQEEMTWDRWMLPNSPGTVVYTTKSEAHGLQHAVSTLLRVMAQFKGNPWVIYEGRSVSQNDLLYALHTFIYKGKDYNNHAKVHMYNHVVHIVAKYVDQAAHARLIQQFGIENTDRTSDIFKLFIFTNDYFEEWIATKNSKTWRKSYSKNMMVLHIILYKLNLILGNIRATDTRGSRIIHAAELEKRLSALYQGAAYKMRNDPTVVGLAPTITRYWDGSHVVVPISSAGQPSHITALDMRLGDASAIKESSPHPILHVSPTLTGGLERKGEGLAAKVMPDLDDPAMKLLNSTIMAAL